MTRREAEGMFAMVRIGGAAVDVIAKAAQLALAEGYVRQLGAVVRGVQTHPVNRVSEARRGRYGVFYPGRGGRENRL